LPIDPINSTSSGNYYTYVTGGSWELNAFLESQKYRNSSSCSQYLPGILKIGTNLSLSPIANTEGLVGYWKFDEGEGIVVDSSDNNNNGTLYGDTSYITGKVGSYALSFDGDEDYITFPYVNIETSLTYSLWFKRLDNGTKVPLSFMKTYIAITDTKINYYPDPGYSYSTYSWINNTDWNHVVVSQSGLNVSIYLNGVVLGSTTNSLEANTTNSYNYIGRWHQGYPTQYFNGFIDDVRIYNRALSAAEIQAIYNAQK